MLAGYLHNFLKMFPPPTSEGAQIGIFLGVIFHLIGMQSVSHDGMIFKIFKITVQPFTRKLKRSQKDSQSSDQNRWLINHSMFLIKASVTSS